MSKDSVAEAAAGCGLLAVGLALLIFLGSIVRGAVTKILWAWFIVPTFGLPPLTTGQAIGLGIVVCFIRPVDLSDVQKKEGYSVGMDLFGGLILNPVLTLIIAYVVKAFLL